MLFEKYLRLICLPACIINDFEFGTVIIFSLRLTKKSDLERKLFLKSVRAKYFYNSFHIKIIK